MAMGGSGVSGGDRPVSVDRMDNVIEIAKFFNSGENLTRMKELADKEKEVDEKINSLGGIERAKNLIAEADEIRRRAEDSRQTILLNAETEAERLKNDARAERAEAESIRKRAQREFQEREEQLEASERDIVKRLKELWRLDAEQRSGQEKLNTARREADEAKNKFEAKLAALKQVAYG